MAKNAKKPSKETTNIVSKRSSKLKDKNITLKKGRKDYKQAQQELERQRGLIYVGHIPHGFYETEMEKYFQQFGKVTNVLICRSGKTGNCKGYGFVEFQNPDVAKIVAQTMDNYIMFKKRLIVELVPYERRPKQLFHGRYNTPTNFATKRKRIRDMIAKNKIMPDDALVARAKNALKNLNQRMKKLTKTGITCGVEPVHVPLPIKQEKVSQPNSECDSVESDDSEVEFRLPKVDPQLLKSSSSTTSQGYKPRKSKALLTKSIKSVKSLISKNTTDKGEKVALISSPLGHTRDVKKVKKRGSKRGITKTTKPVKLNSETVKKIARELIRKKGTPLLNLISTNKRHPKKASKNK